MAEITAKVLVVGGGPGGYVAAIRAGQLGLDTVLVEQGGAEGGLGGTCLNVGCIPSKAVIHAADAYHRAVEQTAVTPFGLRVEHPAIDFARTVDWKDGIVGRLTGGVGALLKRHKVKIVQGHAELVDGKTCKVETDTGPQTIRAEHVILATGSVAAPLPSLPFGGKVISSTEALSLQAIPERLVVVGAGYIGLELGTAFAKLDAKVTIVEAEDRILPAYDAELVRPVAKRLQALGVDILLRARASGLAEGGDSVLIEDGNGSKRSLPANRILVATGRRARLEGFGLERLDLAMNGRFVAVDERCATSMRNVWAVGDVTGEPMLAHRAMAQGAVVAEVIAGHRRVFDSAVIPAVCFTDPEIVVTGLLPGDPQASGARVTSFPFSANGRALSMERSDGFVRIVSDPDTDLILGLQAVGSGVSEFAAQFAMALEMAARLTDLADTVHAHPTLAEVIQEAAMKGLGKALHS